MQFKPEHLTYFDRKTLQTALFNSGFRDMITRSGRKILNFNYIKMHFERFPVAGVTAAVNFISCILPRKMQTRHRHIVTSDLMIFSRKTPIRSQLVLSVIIPAFNEVKTFGLLMESLLKKKLQDLELEIIIVESNSTDGTRELALKYKDHPGVKVLLEERPLGKGHAARTGLTAASGDFVLIQDADLEYDLEDYDALLEPLVAGRTAFVLGS